ncbi:MAG TPA: SH3 domain-containing protein [Candidatus Didemnitutus sp.]|jgi:hypothetical protein
MKRPNARQIWALAVLAGVAVIAEAALVVGNVGYTKNQDTPLKASPTATASVSAHLGFGARLTVMESRGAWLRVSDGRAASGWLFSLMVTDTKPEMANGERSVFGLDGGKTTATAAARPLTDDTKTYASQHNLGSARNDVQWLEDQCKVYSDRDVDGFLRAQKKGEYQ